MSQPLNADQELVSDVVACQLVIKQILDVLDVIVYPTGRIPLKNRCFKKMRQRFLKNFIGAMHWRRCMINAADATRHSEHVGRSAQDTYQQVSHCALHQEWFAVTGHHAAVLFPDRAGN